MSITHNVHAEKPTPKRLVDLWESSVHYGFIIPEIDALLISANGGFILSCDGELELVNNPSRLYDTFGLTCDTECYVVESINIVYKIE